MSTIHRIAPEERVEGQPTPGMTREQAIQTEGMWAGFVRTDPGMVSGWHHHGSYESSIYVLSGSLRMEFGPGGERHAALFAAAGLDNELRNRDGAAVGVDGDAGFRQAIDGAAHRVGKDTLLRDEPFALDAIGGRRLR